MKIVTMQISEMSHQYAYLSFTLRVNASRATMFAFCVLRFAFCVLRFAFCVLRFAFCVLRFAFCVLRFAFCVLIFVKVKISLKKSVNFGQKF